MSGLSRSLRPGVLLVVSVLLPSCGGGGGGGGGSPPPTSIEVSPSIPTIAAGTPQPFAATGLFSDDSTADLTASSTWSSSDDLVATVSNAPGSKGLATGVSGGTVTITATRGALSASTTLTVTSAVVTSIEVAFLRPSFASGTAQPLAATGFFSDGSVQDLTTVATWDSSNDLVLTVGDAPGTKGRATAVSAGTAIATATFGAVSGLASLSVTDAVLVSIQVTASLASIARGTTLPFTATGTFSDATTQDLTAAADWSSNGSPVSVSNAPGSKGLATGVAPGLALLTATVGTESDSAPLTVTDATLQSIVITPDDPTTGPGRTRRFTATGTFSDLSSQDVTSLVIWSSDTPAVALVGNASGTKGVATGISPGTAVIQAELGAISDITPLSVSSAALVSIEVTPADPSVDVLATQAFTATGTFADASVQDLTEFVIWSSSSPGVAQVSNASGAKGKAVGISSGMTTIDAASGGVNNSTTLTVP